MNPIPGSEVSPGGAGPEVVAATGASRGQGNATSEASDAKSGGGGTSGHPRLGMVRAYLDRGWSAIPLRPRSKIPYSRDWPTRRFAPEEFGADDNVGVALGPPSGGLCDLDLDWPEAVALADALVPHLPSFGRASAPRSHRVCLSDQENLVPFKFTSKAERAALGLGEEDKGEVVRLGAGGGQTMFPPSVHPCRETIGWDSGTPPAEVPRVSAADLHRWCGLVAGLSVVARAWPKGPGANHDLSLPLAGALLSAGVGDEDAARLVDLVCRLGGDPDWQGRGVPAVSATRARMSAGDQWAGLPRLLDMLGLKAVEKTIAKWLGAKAGGVSVSPSTGYRMWNGRPTDCIENFRIALRRRGVQLRFDEFLVSQQMCRDDGSWRKPKDLDVDNLQVEFEEKEGLRIEPERFRRYFNFVASENSDHPVRAYLDRVQKAWDETARIAPEGKAGWLTTYLGIEDTDLAHAAGALVLVAHVRRIRQPGAKFDEMVVLEGPQGALKSEALKRMCPWPELFTDGFRMDLDDKAVIERTEGKMLIEIAELSGFRRAEVERSKALLSRSTDRARLAYGRRGEDRPRQFLFWGTTNDSQYLQDRTGNRRVLPFRIGTIDLTGLEKVRDLLWGEAAALESTAWKGKDVRLDPSLYPAHKEAVKAREIENPHKDKLEIAVAGLRGWILTADLPLLVGFRPSQITDWVVNELAAAARAIGLHKRQKKVGGKVTWGYSNVAEEKGGPGPWLKPEVSQSGDVLVNGWSITPKAEPLAPEERKAEADWLRKQADAVERGEGAEDTPL